MREARRALCGTTLFIAIALASFAALAAEPAGRGTISGVVREKGGAPIPGVTVTATRAAAGASAVAVTEASGEFRLTGLTAGTYVLDAQLEGFQRVSKTIKLVNDQTLQIVFTIVPAFGETVDVVAQAVKTGEVAVLESRRQAATVSDSISAEEIRKTPDSSAAGVVERLTGVTLLGDKYVFVRGLGERYSGTTINGATLPTTEAEKRVVPLDLFPAKLLETVNVVKTYTPDKPGDFGSGVVEMSTVEFPSAQSLKLTVGSGYNSSATGNRFRRYAGGLDWMGRGGQSLPSVIPAQFVQKKSSLSNTGFTPEELQRFGQALVGDWTGTTTSSAPPTMDLSLTYGNTFGPLGVVFSGVSNHKYDQVDEVQRFFGLDAGNVLTPANDYDLTTDRESVNSGVVANFSLRLSDNNRVFLNSVLTRDASSENRTQSGQNAASGGEIRDFRVRYQLEEILSTRLRGEHNVTTAGSGGLIEWSAAHSRAKNNSNLRENLYREGAPGVFALQVGFSSSGEADYYKLEDQINQGNLAYTQFYAREGATWSGWLKGGLDVSRRTRDFGARRFALTVANQTQFDLTKTPEELFTVENIRPNGFELREVTGVNDAYDAEHKVDAAYLMSDTTLGKWRLIGGARYETSNQRVSTFNPFDTRNPVQALDKENNVLPSLNAIYQSSSTTNIRFGYGRTVNRPEFRELSPFAFVEVTGGLSIAGNPNLKEAAIDAYDLRWETFPGAGSVIAASVFYKNISRPIERIIQPTSDFRVSFVNADSATLYGAELELRHDLEPLWAALHDFSVNANYAWIKSDVTLDPAQLAAATNLKRPLQGQSDQSANLALQYLRPSSGTMVRFLGSYIGKRLTDVGAFGLPDIYESPYGTFDAVVSQRIDRLKGVELKLAGNNILDAKREFTQAGRIQRRYDPGRSVVLSISYSPF
jgi:TonB-dependent receptor